MRIAIVAFGKLRIPGSRDLADHYLKLLRPWVDLEEIEIKEESQRKPSQLLSDALGRLRGKPRLYLLDEKGTNSSTLEWSRWIQKEREQGSNQILCIAIGPATGWDAESRALAQGILSFGAQTLPHDLARLVLVEQLFRAWSVLKNHPYHNEGSQ